MSPRVSAAVKLDALGTTFGGGPMACAVIEAVIEAIESGHLLEHVRSIAALIRSRCLVGPVIGHQGAGLLVGLRTHRPAKQIHAALLERDILAGTSADPNILRLLPPYVLRRPSTSNCCATRCSISAPEEPPMRRFIDLADFSRDELLALLELARRLESRPEPQALAGKVLGLLFMNPSLRTLASFQSGMARLGGSSFVITPGSGTWQIETRDGVVMDGAAAEHVREGVPVLASYCDALGIRSFADGKDLAADLAERKFAAMAALVDKPLINLESAVNHPCQSLADWKTLDELGIPRGGKFVLSWAYHPRGLPLAVPAATVHMAAMRGMEVVVLRPEGFALPEAIMDKARRAAAAPAARCAPPAIGARRWPARTWCTRRNGPAPPTTAMMPRTPGAPRSRTGAWTSPGSRRRARIAA